MNRIQALFGNTAKTLCAGMIIAGLSSQAQAQQFKRIMTEGEYVATIVGKRLVSDNGNWVRASKDGRMEGEFGGKKLTGRWQWSSGYFCRNGRLGGEEIGSDCAVIEIGGNMTRSTANQGQGRASVYRVE